MSMQMHRRLVVVAFIEILNRVFIPRCLLPGTFKQRSPTRLFIASGTP
jgi:hypothetical protein